MIGAVGVFQDVSERMRAEEAIRSRERLLSGIFEILPIGLWIADERGKFVRGNAAAVKVWAGRREGLAVTLTGGSRRSTLRPHVQPGVTKPLHRRGQGLQPRRRWAR